MTAAMDAFYAEWIGAYIARSGGIVRGFCVGAAKEMQQAFPELTLVRGFAVFENGCRTEHAWLVTPAGDVVDPTASQFTAPFSYRPWQPGDSVRVGTCMNCGMGIYKAVAALDGPTDSVCSPECENELRSFYEGG